MIKLGRLKIKNQLVLAPMAMYTDIAFVKLCQDYGCSYAFTELIPSAAFIRKLEGMKKKMDFSDNMGIQFISNDPKELKEAIMIVNNKEFYPGLDRVKSIDLNLGCPMEDIMQRNLGAALLKKPAIVRELFKTMNKYSELPTSAKIRLGINTKHKKTKPYLRIAKIAKEENIDFITIHARTAGQQNSGDTDISAIREVRDEVEIPIIGNGGIVDEDTAKKMLDVSDAIMIGQRAVKDPFIFKQLDYLFNKNKRWEYDRSKEKMKCINKYFDYADQYYVGFQHVKVHIQSLLKGIPCQKTVIDKMTHTHNIDEIKALVKTIKT